MRPFTSLVSLDEARKRLTAAARPIDRTERVRLPDASGRVAAADATSGIDVPPFARAAMDGYAVIAADTVTVTHGAPIRLRRVDRVFTGARASRPVEPGTCSEIATGAPLPPGADAVVMVEDTKRVDDTVLVAVTVSAGQNVGRQGADVRAGALLIQRGDLLNPGRIGALAAAGHTEVSVFARPRVAILSTGNEVVEPGAALGPGQIYDVNRYTLAATISAHGGVPEPQPPVHDDLGALNAALDRSVEADIIVFSGGSSVGERDLILDLISQRGEMIFHGVAIKPGKPTAFGCVSGKPFFGMPGNPTSCLSNAYVLLVPFLRQVARLPPHRPETIRLALAARISSTAGRHQFYTVRVADGRAWPAFKGSGDITSLSQADGFIEIPSDQSIIEAGSFVDVTLI